MKKRPRGKVSDADEAWIKGIGYAHRLGYRAPGDWWLVALGYTGGRKASVRSLRRAK